MARYLVDSWSWVAYFAGEERGAKVRPLVESESEATSMLTLMELADVYAQRDPESIGDKIDFIASHTTILDLDPMVSEGAGRTKRDQRARRIKIGIVDAAIYETAQQNDLTLVTGDPDFKGLDGVEFIG